MNVDVGEVTPRRVAKTVLSNVPVTVLVFAGIAWWLADNGIYRTAESFGLEVVLNPANWVLSMFMHADWSHFDGNVQFWLLFGTVLTVLTSNRHVLLVAVVSHVLMLVVGVALIRFGVGMSGMVFAVTAAALVRSTGYALQNASVETLRNGLAAVLVPVLGLLLLVMVLAGPSSIGHLEHFLAFLFGAAIEAMYVLDNRTSAGPERSIPKRLGR